MDKHLSAKLAFLDNFQRREQLGILYDTDNDLRNEVAKLNKERLKMLEDMKFMRGEIQGIGRRKNGNGDHPTLTTSQKFEIEFTKRNAWWLWYRDKVLASTLSNIHTIIILAILYFVFGGKIPTP